MNPTKTPEMVHSELVDASRVWVHLRDRVARTGERDAGLLNLRNNQMEHIHGLLDQYVIIMALEGATDAGVT